jgi:amino acid transporter
VLRPFNERKTAFAATHAERVGSGRGVGGLIAPSMAINGNPQGTAAVVGRAVPLAFRLSTAGALLIAYTFVRLSQRFSHAGSVYGLVGETLGPRAGSVAGWFNAGTYLFYGVVTSTAAGIFINDLTRKRGQPTHLRAEPRRDVTHCWCEIVRNTLYRNIIPWRSGGTLERPGLAIPNLAVITIAVLAHPGAARRAGAKLARADGLAADSNLC